MATKELPRFVTLILILALLSFPGNLTSAQRMAAHAQDSDADQNQDVPPSSPAADAGQPVDNAWWTQVQASIQAAEYEVTWQEDLPLPDAPAAYQAPNRAQGLRTYFLPDGILILPRNWTGDGASLWQLRLALADAGSADPVVERNRITYRRLGSVAEWYRNEPAGLTQEFEIAGGQGAGGVLREGLAVVTLVIETSLSPTLAADGQWVDFADTQGAGMLRYAGLQATDAAGRSLPARLALTPAADQPAATAPLQIIVDATNAAYPLVVTAVLTSLAAPAGLGASPAWAAYGDQTYAGFGLSVATAGDVNGDGYADVIVGAPYFDHGQGNEGRAYVYYGAAGGLSTSPGWDAESNQTSAIFGYSVATAGDVNGDGYADVIVGAIGYYSGQAYGGAAFVYYGSAGGLSGAYGWIAMCGQAGAYFGLSVATAGDINGDGYADVIISAPDYDNGQIDEGRVFAYYGAAGGLGASPAWTAESDQAGAEFGHSVGTAGDVNGDGYADVVVGAPDYDGGQTNEGMVYVYHGAAGGLSSSPNWTAESNQPYASFGNSVATAGDVNGDGYADVIVGAPYYDGGQTDEGRTYVYHGSATGLAASAAWTAETDQAGALFGWSVATAGDVNGDGYADVIAGAPYYDNGQTNEGRAYAYHGSAMGLTASAVWTAESNQAYTYFGQSVATAGDVNGDGYADVVVGAPEDLPYGGVAYVYHGTADALSANPGWTTESDKAGAWLGYSVATAGDVNGDGYADVVVGAPRYDNGQANEGRAFIYYGAAGGLHTTPDWSAESDQTDANFGIRVATAGDVNSDGYADIIVGAYWYANGQYREGRAYVYYGSAGGLGASPGWIAEGDQTEAWFGNSVATAGDVNGDGYADVIVGAPRYDNGKTDEGRAYVYYGSAGGLSTDPGWTAESNWSGAFFGGSVATAGDVNGDGYADVIVGARYYDGDQVLEGRAYVYHGSAGGLSTSPAWIAECNQAHAEFGESVATAGDVNGDGYADVIVGAPFYDNGQYDEGGAFIYYGAASGLGASPGWTALGDQADAHLGWSAATAGDVNGDGYADLIVAAPWYDNGQTDEGRAYVFYGAAGGLSTSATWTAEGNQASVYFGYSVASAGDVNGDGYADIIVGASWYDNGQTDEGMVSAYYGDGGGLALLPRQRRVDNTAPIAPGGRSDRMNGFRVALLGRTPFGRGQVKLEWEVKPLDALFDGQGIGSSPSWASTGTAGASLSQLVTGLAPRTPYHWRVRLRYQPASSPFQQHSRWITVPWNGWNETDLRTGGHAAWLPLVLR